jgi:hypothetical protein
MLAALMLVSQFCWQCDLLLYKEKKNVLIRSMSVVRCRQLVCGHVETGTCNTLEEIFGFQRDIENNTFLLRYYCGAKSGDELRSINSESHCPLARCSIATNAVFQCVIILRNLYFNSKSLNLYYCYFFI